MIRRHILAASAALTALALAPQPLAAQDTSAAGATEEMDQALAMMGQMFPAEPLTPEQQARLPQAQRIIARMIPEGALGEMMGTTFDALLGPIMKMEGPTSMATVTEATGLSSSDLDLDGAQSDELAAIFDAAWSERQAREMALFPAIMAEMMDLMEPGMRKAMAELYAINFTPAELSDIEAFFLTETGTSYARKSFAMASDPRIISASMEAMPQLMGAFAAMEQKFAEASAGLPPKRSFAQLSAAERARVAELTGFTVAQIEAAAAVQAQE